MYRKRYSKAFHSQARTLDVIEVSNGREMGGVHSRQHPDGWTIEGQIHEDYYIWVNDFTASHPVYGKVWGDFESNVYATDKKAFDNFMLNHSPEEWDYYDI